MLIVGPNSTCDICMENYMDGAGVPHAIPCGHIFCRPCLDRMRPQCPLCRHEFSPQDVRRLRVDGGAAAAAMAASQADAQVQSLMDGIAKTADGRATVEEIQRVIDLCDAYREARPNGTLRAQFGVSYLLLSALLGAQRKLLSQAEQLSKLAAAKDDGRYRLGVELDAVRLECGNLERARRSEREAARRNEEVFRAQYDRMNALWKSKLDQTRRKYRSMREELYRLRQTNEIQAYGEAGAVIPLCDAAIPSSERIDAEKSSGEVVAASKMQGIRLWECKVAILVFAVTLSVILFCFILFVTFKFSAVSL